MFNLAVDGEHVALAFGLRWIEALARRFDHVDVVTMTVGAHGLPANVRVWSVGRERGLPEWLRVLRFYQIVWRILRERRIAVVFSHMIPEFSVLFWPVARVAGLGSVLWYAHGATPWTLRLAHRLIDRVVSSTPEGFRLPSTKVDFIGQGIDTSVYHAAPRLAGSTFQIVTVGRLARVKGLDLLISALQGWRPGIEWKLTIVGDGITESERAYGEALRQQACESSDATRVTFTGRLDAKRIASLIAEADVFVNLGATGSLDKAIVEAMACGCPVVSSNDAFRSLATASGFPECAIERTPKALRSALDRLVAMGAPGRQALAERQSAVALRDHTLDGLMDRLHAILESVARRGAS